MGENRKKGFMCEKIVADYFQAQDYEVVGMNFIQYGIGEIDLIAVRDNTIYFIEVRAIFKHMDNPISSINQFKIAKILKTSQYYIFHNTKFRSFNKKVLFVTLMRKNNAWIIQQYEI